MNCLCPHTAITSADATLLVQIVLLLHCTCALREVRTNTSDWTASGGTASPSCRSLQSAACATPAAAPPSARWRRTAAPQLQRARAQWLRLFAAYTKVDVAFRVVDRLSTYKQHTHVYATPVGLELRDHASTPPPARQRTHTTLTPAPSMRKYSSSTHTPASIMQFICIELTSV
mgnify:CR=1 FL=1